MPLIENVCALYLLDRKLRGLTGRLNNATNRTAVQEKKLEQLHTLQNELTHQHKVVQAKAQSLEHEAQGADGRVNLLREKMNSVRTNKEYSALLVEVNTLKDDKSRMETEALEQLAQVDELAAKLQAVTTDVAEQEKLVTFGRDEIVDANAEVADSLAQVKAEREEAVKEVPVDVMRLYDRMADAYEGEALAEILEESRRHLEYSCGGCYTIIPYERVNAVMSSIDEITSCPSCNRILHIGQDLRASLVK